MPGLSTNSSVDLGGAEGSPELAAAEVRSLVDAALADSAVSESDRHCLVELAEYVAGGVISAVERPDELDTPRPPLPHVNRTLARRIVRRVCQMVIGHAWSRYIGALPSLDLGSLQQLSTRAMIGGQNLLIEVLEEHAESNSPSSRLLRLEMMDRLMNGDLVDDLAERLGLRLANCYIVASMANGRSERGLLDPLRYRPDVFVALRDEHLLVLLPAFSGILRSEAKELCQKQLTGLSGDSAISTVAVAVARNRQEVPSAVEESRSVLRLTGSLRWPVGYYATDDLPMEMALLRSPDLANMLALRLAPLVNSGAPLVETLRIYLEYSQDRRHASRALHIHPNTLDYRLRRIRELTGLTPTVPRDIQVLGAALAAWRLTGMDGPHDPVNVTPCALTPGPVGRDRAHPTGVPAPA